jgi:CHRD domain
MTTVCKLTCDFTVIGGMLAPASSAVAQPFGEQATPFSAVLNGGNECNGASPPLCRNGDVNGFGSATIIFPTATSVCFGITVSGLTGTPTAAHIHFGPSGINGGIFVVLTPPTAGNPGASSGCVSGVSAATIAGIRFDPREWYVNVHTTNFPGGAIRGQLQ